MTAAARKPRELRRDSFAWRVLELARRGWNEERIKATTGARDMAKVRDALALLRSRGMLPEAVPSAAGEKP